MSPWYNLGMNMNTIAWKMEKPEYTLVLALHGDTALLVRTDFIGEVWQFRKPPGRDAAIARLIHETTQIEGDDGSLVGEPVEFDLTPDARSEIEPGDKCMEWVQAATLRDELFARVDDPSPLFTAADVAAVWSVPVTMLSIGEFEPTPIEITTFDGKTHFVYPQGERFLVYTEKPE